MIITDHTWKKLIRLTRWSYHCNLPKFTCTIPVIVLNCIRYFSRHIYIYIVRNLENNSVLIMIQQRSACFHYEPIYSWTFNVWRRLQLDIVRVRETLAWGFEFIHRLISEAYYLLPITLLLNVYCSAWLFL